MRALLLQKGAVLHERDLFDERLSKKELRELLGNRSASDLFSWRSPSFKKLGMDRAALNENSLIALMLEEPRLIQRPIIQFNNNLMIRPDLSALENLFS